MLLPRPIIDEILTLQLTIAWAGEGETDPPRLGWWRSGLTDPFGGGDLMRRIAPRTAEWAILQATREAARRTDGEARGRLHEPDRFMTLFHLGFTLDEQLTDRLAEVKRSAVAPADALPGTRSASALKSKAASIAWVSSFKPEPWDSTPVGRRVKGDAPADPALAARRLVGALQPISESWTVPYFERGPST